MNNTNSLLIIYSNDSDKDYLRNKALTTLVDVNHSLKEVKQIPIFYSTLSDIAHTWLSDKEQQEVMKSGFAVEWRESGRGSYIVFEGYNVKNYPDSILKLLAS